MAQFKEKKGQQKFNEAKIKYGQELKLKLEQTFKQPKYQKLSDDDKLKVINGIDSDAMNKIFKQYNFKYKQEKSKKLPKF